MSDTPISIDLSEEALDAAAAAAAAAFAEAADLAQLAEARRAHLGDDAPIPQARRALGSIPKAERKDAGRRVNMARGRVEKNFAQRQAVLEEEDAAQQPLSEAGDAEAQQIPEA